MLCDAAAASQPAPAGSPSIRLHTRSPCPPQLPPTTPSQSVLAAQGVSVDLDELECMTANLIVREGVKGYIAHKQKVLVMSKDAPFPPPSAHWWQDPF